MRVFAQRRPSAPASLLAGALLAFGTFVVAGCGGSDTPSGGDPGGKRLNRLSSDGVFASLPDGATEVGTERRGARYREPGFTGGGWDGPTVIVTFKSASPPEDVYGFYARHAAAAGWKPTAAGELGLTDRWSKTYPDGAPATLTLTLTLLERASGERVYRLSGGVAPATS